MCIRDSNEAELAESIHEKADTGPRSADHIRQGFLSDGWNQGFGLAWFAKFRHQEKDAGQALLAGIRCV